MMPWGLPVTHEGWLWFGLVAGAGYIWVGLELRSVMQEYGDRGE